MNGSPGKKPMNAVPPLGREHLLVERLAVVEAVVARRRSRCSSPPSALGASPRIDVRRSADGLPCLLVVEGDGQVTRRLGISSDTGTKLLVTSCRWSTSRSTASAAGRSRRGSSEPGRGLEARPGVRAQRVVHASTRKLSVRSSSISPYSTSRHGRRRAVGDAVAPCEDHSGRTSTPASASAARTAAASSTAFGPSPWMQMLWTRPFLGERDRAPCGLGRVSRLLHALQDQPPLGVVVEIDVALRHEANAGRLGGRAQLGRHQQRDAEHGDRLAQRACELLVLGHHRVQRPVRLYMPELHARRFGKRAHRACLVEDEVGTSSGERPFAAARTRPDPAARRARRSRRGASRRARRCAAHVRIAAVEARSDVRRGQVRHQRRVVAERPAPERFAQVGVEVELMAPAAPRMTNRRPSSRGRESRPAVASSPSRRTRPSAHTRDRRHRNG